MSQELVYQEELINEVESKQKIEGELSYGIEDRPELKIAIPLAIQHIVAAFSGIVAVPLVVGGVLGLTPVEMGYLVSAALFMAGLATFIQAKGFGKVGSKLPCIMGTDFTFVGPSIAVGSTMGLPGIFGATLLAAPIEMIISKFFPKIKKFFPPVVTGCVVTLIGLTVLPVGIDWAAGGFGAADYGSLENIGVSLAVLAVIITLNQFAKGFWSSAAILIGIVFGYVISYPLGMLDFSAVQQAALINLPMPFKYGIAFSLTGFLAFIPAYLVTSVETVGDLLAVGEACNKELESEDISKGLMADGVGSMLAGVFGAGPNTSFSQNVGIIPLTGVASRFVVILAGIILMILGIFPKLGALIAIMPNPVLGGAGIVMFGMIAASGIKVLHDAELNRRNLLIIAISLGLGLGVVVRPDILSHLPKGLNTFFQSGITTGTLTALVLNIVLPEMEE
ncbi:NCS2 family nucleobase:cation symporter-2 [Orenia metallireducens]|jgi:NCS2 family nucleobase:cation symporter-2|uniref:Nucleobase:cation symporter-2, NCS2 family n=1 Tax=Orenia metallireducens TaxID=1413210 RepID=A0A285IEF7_9FIRM|nr:nucleobase:cation symporter-2 family protein [Orenia metallireducens]PRX28023.1 NCS2 family nucleobase:cation symporter-2 [Orenia metallireducens]SNY45456.1 nucleobase:cation symporter-2, NCS2 family [Orenia metallireducens]